MKRETKKALWTACAKHPDLARALLGLLDPEPVKPTPRKVKRTPTAAKMLRTG